MTNECKIREKGSRTLQPEEISPVNVLELFNELTEVIAE